MHEKLHLMGYEEKESWKGESRTRNSLAYARTQHKKLGFTSKRARKNFFFKVAVQSLAAGRSEPYYLLKEGPQRWVARKNIKSLSRLGGREPGGYIFLVRSVPCPVPRAKSS